MLVKYKDIGFPTITIFIGQNNVGRILMDLESSDKPVTLHGLSADRSKWAQVYGYENIVSKLVSIHQKVAVEDVLVWIENFFFPIDVVVIETTPVAKTSL